MVTGRYILQFFLGLVDDLGFVTTTHLVWREFFVMIYYVLEPCIPRVQTAKYVHILIFILDFTDEIYTVNYVVVGVLCKCFITYVLASFLINILPFVVVSYLSSGRLPYISWGILELLQHG
jgi:hypothetical protein